MHQYFVNEELEVGKEYYFTKEQAHHIKNVLRMDGDTVRLVYNGEAYFGVVQYKDKDVYALIKEKDTRVNEPNCKITLAMALIRKEKFELVLQKATELGVSRIVPFESSRCVVHAKSEKKDKQKARWESIILEASEQCKRNIVPELSDIVSFNDLKDYQSKGNYACYENAYGNAQFLSQIAKNDDSITIVIGPEGGFSLDEVKQLEEMGYTSITLGSRILRAETAAMYACSVVSENSEAK